MTSVETVRKNAVHEILLLILTHAVCKFYSKFYLTEIAKPFEWAQELKKGKQNSKVKV